MNAGSPRPWAGEPPSFHATRVPPHPGRIEVWRDGHHVETHRARELDPSACYHPTAQGWVPIVRVEWLGAPDPTHVCRRYIGPEGQMLAVDYLIADRPGDVAADDRRVDVVDEAIGPARSSSEAPPGAEAGTLAARWEAWASTRLHQLAVASVVVGALGLVLLGYLLGPVALFLGSSSITPTTPSRTRRLAIAGMILGSVGLIGHLLLL